MSFRIDRNKSENTEVKLQYTENIERNSAIYLQLDTIVKDYDKNIVLRDCQRQAFEYLHQKLSHDRCYMITCFGTSRVY
jgi:hypothetical protein